MNFYIEEHSSTPVINQIEEQIKFAVMMGIFRNGDTLPSIRDIEKQTGVHHSQIHKAYLSLRRSGLLVMTRGKGSVIATAAESPLAISEKCLKLSQQITSKACHIGLSPTAFARYLSRYAQESERNSPFISYVDAHGELAIQTAAEISQIWQVPVKGIDFEELKKDIANGTATPKILVNHILSEYIRPMLTNKKSTVIQIEVRISEHTMNLLAGIKRDSSVLLIHQPHPAHRVHYMVEQIGKLIKSPGVHMHSTSIRKIRNFGKLLSSSEYDYYLIGPGVRGEVPHEHRRNSRVLQIDPQLDLASLETARIRAGVVI